MSGTRIERQPPHLELDEALGRGIYRHQALVTARQLRTRWGWQVDAVRSAFEAHGIDPMPPITPVLCFLNVEWPLLGAPETFRDVRLESHRSIKRLMTKSVLLTEPQSDHLLAVLSEALPPK